MKKFRLISAMLITAASLSAQPPQGFNYQAVVRNASSDLISNQNVGFRTSIREGTSSGTIVYQETHTAITNQFGLATLIIGGGNPVIGDFGDIEWFYGTKFLEVECDPLGGTAYIAMGTAPLMSVPFAFYTHKSADSYWDKVAYNLYYNSGSIGIGTSTPVNAKLQIEGTGAYDAMFRLNNLGTNGAAFFMGSTNSAWGGGTNQNLFVMGHGAPSSANIDMTFAPSGSVGIGTTSPGARLHIAGDQWPNSYMYIQSNAGQDAGIRLYEGTTAKWHLFNSSTLGGLMVYNTNGQTAFFASQVNSNVGIGTTDPEVALKVATYSQFNPGDVGDNRKGSILLSLSGGSTGLYQYGPAIAFSGINTSRRRAAIAAIQTSSDSDHIGLAFFTHAGSTTSNDEIAQMMVIQHNGYVGIGTSSPVTPLDVKGNITVRDETSGEIAVELGTGLDYAEGFDVSEINNVEPGTVMCIDPENPGKLKISDSSYDCKVVGIVAGANQLGSGIILGSEAYDVSVALAGRVYCNVDATLQAIQAGDMLTTSAIPGYAMKVTDREKAQGAILGKAMENLHKGSKGQILVLVTLQ